MKLLIVTQYFYPERFVINELALDLSRLGHQVTVLTGMPNYPSGKFAPGYGRAWPVQENYHGVRVMRVPILPRFKGTALQLFLNYISYAASASLFAPFMLRENIDAILVFEPSPITVGLPALVMKRLKGARILFWVQDLWPDSLVATGGSKTRRCSGGLRALHAPFIKAPTLLWCNRGASNQKSKKSLQRFRTFVIFQIPPMRSTVRFLRSLIRLRTKCCGPVFALFSQEIWGRRKIWGQFFPPPSGSRIVGRPIVAALDGEGARIVEEAQAGLTCAAGDPKQLAAIVERLYQSPKPDREAMGQAGRRYFEREFDRGVLLERL